MAVRPTQILRLAALIALLAFVAIAGKPLVHAVSEHVAAGDPALGEVPLRPEVSGVVSLSGEPAAGIEVSLGRADEDGPPCGTKLASVLTNHSGRFRLPELRGRMSELQSEERQDGQIWVILCIGPPGATVPDVLFPTSAWDGGGRHFRCDLPRPSTSAYDPRACR